MSRKRKFAVFLAIVCVMSALSGCSVFKTAKDDRTVVTVWSVDSHSESVYKRIVNDYNNGQGEKDGIFIDYQVKSHGKEKSILKTLLQSGEGPDLFNELTLVEIYDKSSVVAIEELPGGAKFLEKYKGSLYENVNTYRGKTYSVPIFVTTQGLLYNKDMFIAAGIVDENGEPTPPETLEELREYAKRLTNPEKRQFGIIFPMGWHDWFRSDVRGMMQNSYGFDLYNPKTGKYDYSGIVPIAETFLAMYNDGSVFPESEKWDNDAARALFAAGNIGMKFGFSFDVGVLNDQFPAQCNWSVAPYPVVDAGQKYKQRMEYNTSFFISRKALDTVGGEKLLKVLEFFASDMVQRELYKTGMALPLDPENMEVTENQIVGWQEFAELVKCSARYAEFPAYDEKTRAWISEKFAENAWAGTETYTELAKEFSDVMNAAVEEYYAMHPEESMEDFIDEEWDLSR